MLPAVSRLGSAPQRSHQAKTARWGKCVHKINALKLCAGATDATESSRVLVYGRRRNSLSPLYAPRHERMMSAFLVAVVALPAGIEVYLWIKKLTS